MPILAKPALSGFWLLVRRDWRERFPTPWAGLGEAVALGLGLSLYWFTARAFGKGARLDGLAPDYFSFVVLGEAVLLLPLYLISGFLRAVREAQADGTLEALFGLPGGGARGIVALGLASVPREAGRAALLLGVAALVFGFRLAPGQLAWLALAQLLALPTSIAIGLGAAAFFLRLGRGEAALGFLAALASILAGAYFPVTVFPPALAALAQALSPFNALLGLSRAAMSQGWGGVASSRPALLALAGWAALALPLAWRFLAWSLDRVKERGTLEIIRTD